MSQQPLVLAMPRRADREQQGPSTGTRRVKLSSHAGSRVTSAQSRPGTMATFMLSALMLVRIARSASASPNSWLTISAKG